MNEARRYEGKETFSKEATDETSAFKKIQYQLDAIERKLDSLLKQSGSHDSKSRHDSRSYRQHDKAKSPYKAKHGARKAEARSEGKFYDNLQSGPKRYVQRKRKSPLKSRE